MRNITFRLLSGLVLIAAIAGIALLAYNAGIARGEALSAAAPASQTNPAYPAYPMPFFWWPFPFFGIYGLIALFFLLSIAFRAARHMVWGPRYGWHWMNRRYGRWGDPGTGEDIPPMFTEMHRRMHEAEEGKSAEQSTQNRS